MTAAEKTPRPVSVSIETAGDMIGISRRAVYGLLERGELRSLHVGRRRLIPVDSIEALVRGGRQ